MLLTTGHTGCAWLHCAGKRRASRKSAQGHHELRVQLQFNHFKLSQDTQSGICAVTIRLKRVNVVNLLCSANWNV